jgi:type III pantothenate kinase
MEGKGAVPLLAIDIGNSSINIGIFTPELVLMRLKTHPLRSPSWYGDKMGEVLRKKGIDKGLEGVVISSVVPGHTEALMAGARMLSGREPLLVGPGLDTGLRFEIESPEELGSDRIASSAAAAELHGPPVAVLDFGTATTVSFVGRGHVFKGGAILPGLELMGRSLSQGTAKLPEVSPGAPVSALGKDTVGNILSGMIYGTAGAVERIISAVEELEGETYGVAATGGYMGLVLPHLRRAVLVEPALTLMGLKSIFERNG